MQHHTWRIGIDDAQGGDLGGIPLAGVFAETTTTLTAGSQMCRFGFLARASRTEPQELSGLHEVCAPPNAPAVLILVPSYKEEPRVIRQVLLSAKLQDHPRR